MRYFSHQLAVSHRYDPMLHERRPDIRRYDKMVHDVQTVESGQSRDSSTVRKGNWKREHSRAYVLACILAFFAFFMLSYLLLYQIGRFIFWLLVLIKA